MVRLLLLLSLLFMPFAYSRNAKWYFPRRTVTSVIQQRRLVTSVVPSSCVVIDPSLPTCRNVRRIDIAPTKPTRIESTALPEIIQPRSLEIESGEAESGRGSSWGEGWLWNHHTVTHTVVNLQTVRQYDPDAVVSIVFKGCQPTSLPFKLSPCNSTTNATQQMQRELYYNND